MEAHELRVVPQAPLVVEDVFNDQARVDDIGWIGRLPRIAAGKMVRIEHGIVRKSLSSAFSLAPLVVSEPQECVSPYTPPYLVEICACIHVFGRLHLLRRGCTKSHHDETVRPLTQSW